MNYVDFDLSLEPSEGKYRACVCSPGGEGESQFTSPFSEQDLRIFRLEATRARTDLRRMESTGMKAAREFGEKLYQAVFTGLVRDCLTRSLDGVVPGETGLRIRVDLSKTPELVNLPWEYLYEPSQKRFLALSEDTPVVNRAGADVLDAPGVLVLEVAGAAGMLERGQRVVELDVLDARRLLELPELAARELDAQAVDEV